MTFQVLSTLSPQNNFHPCFIVRYWLDLESNDVMWNVSDTGWAKSAYSSFFAPWWQGSCVFVHHTPRFDVRKTLEIMQKYPISVACLPPTAYRMMIQEDLSSYTFKGIVYCVTFCIIQKPEWMIVLLQQIILFVCNLQLFISK